MLFAGHKSELPTSDKLTSYGQIWIARPHISLLRNGQTGNYKGRTKAATWSHGRGRVSATMIEPYDTGPWFTPLVADWMRRGAPTVMSDVRNGPANVDSITFRQSRISNGIILSPLEQAAVTAEVEERLAKLNAEQHVDPQYVVEQTEALFERRKGELIHHWLKRSISLQIAAKLAAEQVKLDLAFDAIDKAGRWAYVDGPTLRAELMETALEHADEPNAGGVVEAALNEIPKLEELYLYELAVSVAKSALSAAVLSEDEYLCELASEQLERVEQRQKAMADQAELLAAWKESPDDPELLDQVGRFLAFQMNDWELGLECLAKSEDVVLGDLARSSRELPNEAALVIRIGDRWREVAETKDAAEKQSIEQFVRGMYRDLGESLREVSVVDRQRAMDFMEAGPSVEDSVAIRLTLDGYGLLTITRYEASWETKTGLEPKEITVGRQTWGKVTEPLSNAGANRFLDPRVDFSTARLSRSVGRGLIRMVDRTRDAVTLRINDLPRGEDEYEIEISFGK